MIYYKITRNRPYMQSFENIFWEITRVRYFNIKKKKGNTERDGLGFNFIRNNLYYYRNNWLYFSGNTRTSP